MSTTSDEKVFRYPTNSGGWVIDRDSPSARPTLRQGMLDQLLRYGGLALPPPPDSGDGLIILLRGKAGTGKSTLALQLAANLSRPPAADGAAGPLVREFLSLEQDSDELKSVFRRMRSEQEATRKNLLTELPGSDLIDAKTPAPRGAAVTPAGDDLICADGGRIAFSESASGEQAHLVEDPLARAHDFVEQFSPGGPREQRSILFIDGLSTLSEENRARLEMAALVNNLRKRCLIGVIAYEPSRGVEESLDHQVDIVIELEEKHLSDPIAYVLHELHIKKARYQDAALGWHQYKIRGYGLEIYPSVHFQVHSHLYMSSQLVDSARPVERKDPDPKASRDQEQKDKCRWSVIEKVLHGIKPGDSVALLGPRGAFKTTLTLDFLFRSQTRRCPLTAEELAANGLADAEPGLLVSIIDNEDTLRIHQSCPIRNAGGIAQACFGECCEHVFLFYQRPGCISSSEFLYYLKTRLLLAKKPIRRLAFWDLTQLEHRFPLLANDQMFIPALLDLFKLHAPKQNSAAQPESTTVTKSIFMGAANARLSSTIAAVADNVIFCWRDRPKRNPRGDRTAFDRKVAEIWTDFAVPPNGNDHDPRPSGADHRQYLMLYVDRTSGGFAQERQSLYAFPILGGSQLAVPAGDWNPTRYGIDVDLIPLFEQAEGQIRHVTEMQGFGAEAASEDSDRAASAANQPL